MLSKFNLILKDMEINENLLLKVITISLIYAIKQNVNAAKHDLTDIFGDNSDVPEHIIEHIDKFNE